MGVRGACWAVFLAGLPFAHLVFRPHLDLWHGQALWAQAWIVLLFGTSFGMKTRVRLANWPLAAWMVWVGAITLWWCTMLSIEKHVYGSMFLMPVWHIMCMAMFYQVALQDWTAERIR